MVSRALRIALALVVVTAGVGATVARPAVGVADRGDWGEVTDERTEIITTLWVTNPNPVGLQVGQQVAVDYHLVLNDVPLADGQKSGIDLEPGNNTVTLTTRLRNERLGDWWAAYVRANETVHLRASGTARVDVGPFTLKQGLPTVSQTTLDDSTPVISALSRAASRTEGRYTVETAVGTAAGYEIREAWATWGGVSDEHTTVLFHFRIHNPGAVPVPAVPDGLGLTVDMNDQRVLQSEGGATAVNVATDATIAPGETRAVVLAVEMDNERAESWFVSHVRNGEHTTIRTHLQLVFSVGSTTIRTPEDGVITYECELQTAILVDDQQTETTCGSGGELTVGG